MFKSTPGTPAPPLAIKTAARFLRVSATPIRKGLASGVIPDLSLSTVDALSRREVLTEVVSATGAPIPVLRLTPWQSETQDDANAPARTGLGYRHGMSDADFLASCDRWWKPSGRDLVLAARAMLVANGSIIVGWIDLIDDNINFDSSGRLHYTGARLVARLDDTLTRTSYLVNADSPNAAVARVVMGLRVLGGGGGSITGIDPSASGPSEYGAAPTRYASFDEIPEDEEIQLRLAQDGVGDVIVYESARRVDEPVGAAGAMTASFYIPSLGYTTSISELQYAAWTL